MGWNYDGTYTTSTGKTFKLLSPEQRIDPKDFQSMSQAEQQEYFNATTPQGKPPPSMNTPLPGPEKIAEGLAPKQIAATAPGATLDTSNAEDERGRLEDLLGQLQQQATTGGGEWEGALADATARAQQTASAIGQSQANTGGGYSSALRNIGNAESQASQRAVGQGNILRAQSQQNAQGQISDLTGSMGAQDVDQARLEAAAKQQRREANATLVGQARTNFEKGVGAIGDAVFSEGGSVPGRPQVFGDDERNDTVPAMLSPGEIVVPRTSASDPEAAADFARAVAMRKGPQRMADGGGAGDTGLETLRGPNTEETAKLAFLPHIGSNDYFGALGGGPQGASIENGGLLDTTNFDANRAAATGLMDQLGGPQPTVTGQQMTSAQDDSIAGALQQQQNQQASNNANAMAAAVGAQQGAGGEAAATRGNEQARTQALLAKTGGAQRGRDLGMALAQQQAGYRNTAMNAGLDLAQQQAILNAVSGGAQAISALAHAGPGREDDDPFSLAGGDGRGDTSSANDTDLGGGDDGSRGGGGDEEGDTRSARDTDDEPGFAHGGAIGDDERSRAKRFLAQLRRAA